MCGRKIWFSLKRLAEELEEEAVSGGGVVVEGEVRGGRR